MIVPILVVTAVFVAIVVAVRVIAVGVIYDGAVEIGVDIDVIAVGAIEIGVIAVLIIVIGVVVGVMVGVRVDVVVLYLSAFPLVHDMDVNQELHLRNADSLFRNIDKSFKEDLLYSAAHIRCFWSNTTFHCLEIIADRYSLVRSVTSDHLMQGRGQCPTVTLFAVHSAQIGLWSHVRRRTNVKSFHDLLGCDDLAITQINDNGLPIGS